MFSSKSARWASPGHARANPQRRSGRLGVLRQTVALAARAPIARVPAHQYHRRENFRRIVRHSLSGTAKCLLGHWIDRGSLLRAPRLIVSFAASRATVRHVFFGGCAVVAAGVVVDGTACNPGPNPSPGGLDWAKVFGSTHRRFEPVTCPQRCVHQMIGPRCAAWSAFPGSPKRLQTTERLRQVAAFSDWARLRKNRSRAISTRPCVASKAHLIRSRRENFVRRPSVPPGSRPFVRRRSSGFGESSRIANGSGRLSQAIQSHRTDRFVTGRHGELLLCIGEILLLCRHRRKRL